MRNRIWSAALAALALVTGSCSDGGPMSPAEPRVFAAPQLVTTKDLSGVRINEIHYDNAGTDTGEQIEITGPDGTSLAGWSIVLYNGAGGASYGSFPLSGTLTAAGSCTRGAVVVATPGLQNGSPDGIALIKTNTVDNSITVVEFLSYEGVFTATNGPAKDSVSTDIGVAQNGSDAVGISLQRSGNGSWSLAPSTFGACNGNEMPVPVAVVASVTVTPTDVSIVKNATAQFTAAAFDAQGGPISGVAFVWSSTGPASVNENGLATGTEAGDASIVATAPNGVSGLATLHVGEPPPPPSSGPVRISEIHYDNAGTDQGEAIEVEAPAGTSLSGWSLVLYNGNGGVVYGTLPLSGTVASSCPGERGVFSVAATGLQNGSPDGIALVNGNTLVEFISYEGVFAATNGPAAGVTSTDIGVTQDGSNSWPAGQSLQRDAEGWYEHAAATFGGCNVRPSDPDPTPDTKSIAITGRDPRDDVPLPVGFEDQLFATFRVGGNVTPTTITWSSDTPTIASIDQNGVVKALEAGTVILRATAADGTVGTISLPTRTATANSAAQYEGNTEFGDPADANPADDFIKRYRQFTVSYNPDRGTPNWVSYDLEASHFGPEDRCDCFTFDPTLPAQFTRYTTADYTGAGAFHGYGIDRGHLARSFDRTAGSLDNAHTFYFSNIIPQAADLNQGPWAVMENFLGDLARFQDKEVYIVAGVAGSKGTVKNEGKITIPTAVWKVALIMPHDRGLADVHSTEDVEIIAVVMPNDPGVRNVNWETYKTTVDAVEALSGYDLLALLPDQIEVALESGTRPPLAVVDGPYTSVEGGTVAMSAGGSSDPDGDALSYAWRFGDGAVATGAAVTHTYTQDGPYTVELTVKDIRGLLATTTTTVTVANVAPSIGPFADAELLPGESYTASGSFADPGADTWSAVVSYGDSPSSSALALAAKSFTLSHVYNATGTFTVTVSVADDDAVVSRTAKVVVLTHGAALQRAIGIVEQLEREGKIDRGNGSALTAHLENAKRQLERGRLPASGQLHSLLRVLETMVQSGRLTAQDALPLRTLLDRVIVSLSR